MGAEFSSPVRRGPTAESRGAVFCVLFCPYDKVRILHAPPEVEDLVLRVAKSIDSRGGDIQPPSKEKLGATQIQMKSGWLFTTGNGKQAATLGKQLCVELLQELHKFGWDLELSSDLARSRHQASTLFFRKNSVERAGARVVCVAPGKQDSLTLLNHDDRVKAAVLEAIGETWPQGIQDSGDTEVLGLTMHDIKMRGRPWFNAEDDINGTRIICKIIGKLSQLGLRLAAGIDIKGGTDSLFFIEDPSFRRTEFCAISLCKSNRLRMVDCKDLCPSIEQVIQENQYHVEDKSVREHHAKLRLNGYPWRCSGYESVKSRQLISRISERLLGQGWALTDALDNSRREDDKSILLYRRCPPTSGRFCCICLTSTDHLRLIDFPPGDQEVLGKAVTQNYAPGITRTDAEPSSLKFSLAGLPWSHPGGTGLGWALHARSMLLHLLDASFQLGYRPAVSADVSARYATDGDGNPDYPLDVHTIYLVKQQQQQQQQKDPNAPPSYDMAVSMFP